MNQPGWWSLWWTGGVEWLFCQVLFFIYFYDYIFSSISLDDLDKIFS